MHVLLLLVLLQAIPSPAPSVPTSVVASNPNLVADAVDRHFLEFVVTNRSSQAVTAWEAHVTARFEDGSTGGWGLEREGYGEYEGVAPGSGRSIQPQGVVTGRIPIDSRRAARIVDLQVTVRWAVFADRSWTGDAVGVAGLFASRQRDYHAMAAVLAVLRAGQARPDPREGLSTALALLDGLDAHTEHSSVKG